MRNRTYGGVRGRKTKVGRKPLRFPPARFLVQLNPFDYGGDCLKSKSAPSRIEKSLSPLYRGTYFSALAETFQTQTLLPVGETVLKVKVPPVGLKNRCRPCSGVQTFQLSPRLFKT